MPESIPSPVVEIRNLRIYFSAKSSLRSRLAGEQHVVRAVDGVSLSVQAGETLGLVGESGCGKSTLGRSVVRLNRPTSGQVWVDGTEVTSTPERDLRPLRRKAQIIFQDPSASLDPRTSVGQTLEEPLINYGIGDRHSRSARVDQLLELVGLPDDARRRYPHQLSGGQRQRVGIAAALALEPKLLVADEPTSALDVSVQAQILNLMAEIQARQGLSYLFISHNLDVVRFISDRVAVMYLGKIVEIGATESIFSEPLHPYTRALISSIPVADPANRRESRPLEGEPPSPLDPPRACRFHPRCAFAKPVCSQIEPALDPENAHAVACHAAHWAVNQRSADGVLPPYDTWDGSSPLTSSAEGIDAA